MYEYSSEKFSGPLEKLLELIEKQKLGIDDVSLAKVTDGFLKYLDDFRDEVSDLRSPSGLRKSDTSFRRDLRVLADFIAIASRLILLKSKYLLPGLALTGEEETEIKDLETRLARYQQLRPAIHVLAKLWRESHKSYSRPYLFGRGALANESHIFYPGPNAGAQELRESIQRVFDTIVKFEMETETIKEKIVTLEEKIKEVMSRVTAEGDTHFKALSSKLAGDSGASRSEMVIVFLALLHLAREQLVRLEQVEQFSDIMVKKNSNQAISN